MRPEWYDMDNRSQKWVEPAENVAAQAVVVRSECTYFRFMSILIAVESVGPDLFRCFYVSADSQIHAECLLREAFPDVG